MLVEDGGIVVLGGLLQDEYRENEEKVPGFGDIPILGNLFKSQNRTRGKRNLMIFLRPVVLRDATSVNDFSTNRYELMRSHQKVIQPKPYAPLPINEAPVMPPIRAVPAPAPAAVPAAVPAPAPAAEIVLP